MYDVSDFKKIYNGTLIDRSIPIAVSVHNGIPLGYRRNMTNVEINTSRTKLVSETNNLNDLRYSMLSVITGVSRMSDHYFYKLGDKFPVDSSDSDDDYVLTKSSDRLGSSDLQNFMKDLIDCEFLSMGNLVNQDIKSVDMYNIIIESQLDCDKLYNSNEIDFAKTVVTRFFLERYYSYTSGARYFFDVYSTQNPPSVDKVKVLREAKKKIVPFDLGTSDIESFTTRIFDLVKTIDANNLSNRICFMESTNNILKAKTFIGFVHI
jgi:hypothetical protein